jgi:hypothetical protein
MVWTDEINLNLGQHLGAALSAPRRRLDQVTEDVHFLLPSRRGRYTDHASMAFVEFLVRFSITPGEGGALLAVNHEPLTVLIGSYGASLLSTEFNAARPKGEEIKESSERIQTAPFRYWFMERLAVHCWKSQSSMQCHGMTPYPYQLCEDRLWLDRERHAK